MNENELKNKLIESPVSQIRAFASIGSTNDEALQWAEDGANDFSLVIADQQTKGRGRFDRRWITKPGASLAFTVIFVPTKTELETPTALYAPLCGLAVWQALHQSLALEPLIKWPNDILLDRQKCCGILVEAAWAGVQCKGIVLGIGVNITADSLPPDAAPRFPATYLENHTRQPVDRFALLANILNAMQYWRSQMGSAEFFDTWQAHLAFRGEVVRIVENENSSIIGIEEGIDSAGNLVIRPESGGEIHIEVGDVHLRPEDSKDK